MYEATQPWFGVALRNAEQTNAGFGIPAGS